MTDSFTQSDLNVLFNSTLLVFSIVKIQKPKKILQRTCSEIYIKLASVVSNPIYFLAQ